MPHQSTVRIADPNDFAALAKLASAFRDQLGRAAPVDSELRAAIAYLLTDGATEFLLALQGEQSNGYAQLRYRHSAWAEGGVEAEIEDLFVLPNARRRGVGQALVQLALDRAVARGCRLVGLNTNEKNAAALALYAGSGFRAEHEFWRGGRQLWLEK